MAFKDWLAGVEAERAAEERAAAPAADPVEAGPPDSFEHLIGKGEQGLGDPSPFDLFLDQVEAERPADFVETVRASEHHDWQIKQAAVYSQDHVVWTCSKCCRTVSVERDETVGQALEKINVREDCSLQVAEEVQDS